MEHALCTSYESSTSILQLKYFWPDVIHNHIKPRVRCKGVDEAPVHNVIPAVQKEGSQHKEQKVFQLLTVDLVELISPKPPILFSSCGNLLAITGVQGQQKDMTAPVQQNSLAANEAMKNSWSEFTTACPTSISNDSFVPGSYSRNSINQAIDLSSIKDVTVFASLMATDNCKPMHKLGGLV
uniref:Uncharacterized protein n=1 Tax=Glossina palpalis gambiensis TaxID=67801 RepID=A0A1B0BMY9_9MUSC